MTQTGRTGFLIPSASCLCCDAQKGWRFSAINVQSVPFLFQKVDWPYPQRQQTGLAPWQAHSKLL